MRTKKTPAPAMTPELYFLEEGPKARDAIKVELQRQNAANQKALDAEVRAELKRRGFKGAELEVKHGDRITGVKDGVIVTFGLTRAVELEVLGRLAPRRKDTQTLEAKHRFLCVQLTTSGAKRFASFCRTKYGRAASAATIAKAFDEWLELNAACSC